MHRCGYLFFLLLIGCGSQPATIPSFGELVEQASPKVYVLPVLSEDKMEMQYRDYVETVTPVLFSPLATMVAQSILVEPKKNLLRPSQQLEVLLAEGTADFSLSEHLVSIVSSMLKHPRFRVQHADHPLTNFDPRRDLTAPLIDGDFDYVVVLTANYGMAPGGHQIDVSVRQDVYSRYQTTSRGEVKPIQTRRLVYQSPPRDLFLRAFADGEKNAYRMAAMDEFTELMEANPSEARRFEKILERELALIDELDHVPVNTAFAETWDRQLLEKYLDEAAAHFQFMLNHEWDTLPSVNTANRPSERFFVLHRGFVEGVRLSGSDLNSIYRDSAGDMYSVY